MIALVGATGRVGTHVAQLLADRPVRARALVRRAGVDLPLRTAQADLRDANATRTALEGARQLFLVTPHGPDQDLLEETAVRAAADAGVTHVVKISGGAASLGPGGVTATATGHWRTERLIEELGLRGTFLRPSYLQQNLLTQVAPTVAKTGALIAPFGRAPVAMVDARDVAACAVAALTDGGGDATRAFQLTGPRGVPFADIAAHLGVRYVAIPPKAAGRALRRQGADAVEADHAVRMAAYFAAGADGAPTDHVRALTGAAPRPVDAFLDEHRDAFAAATPVARLLSATTVTKD